LSLNLIRSAAGSLAFSLLLRKILLAPGTEALTNAFMAQCVSQRAKTITLLRFPMRCTFGPLSFSRGARA